MSDTIPSRIDRLRELMAHEGITMYMIPDSDPHDSEYVGDHFKCREYMSGFTGSNGTLIVMRDMAGLWTDGRYFIQAERELEGSGITLFKMGEPDTPTIREFIRRNIHDGDVFAVDGRMITAKDGREYGETVRDCGGGIRADVDLVSRIWTTRPAMSAEPVTVISDEITGESVQSKISRVRDKMREHRSDAYVLSGLDDIMWLLNIRGRDIECTPVALSYVYMTMDETCLFLQDAAVTPEAKAHFDRNDISVLPYESFHEILKNKMPAEGKAENNGNTGHFRIMADLKATNYSVYDIIRSNVVDITNPTAEMEAVRNEVQMKNIREVYVRDSAVLTRFLYFVKTAMSRGEDLDEYSIAMKLDEMRSHIPGFMELSFPTISAYGANAAMMHYEATEDSHSRLEPEGMYLVDSGGQYLGGTTDVTRTIAVGPVTEEMKRDFTLVAVGMLRLADAVFLEGCTGRNLDILARGELWKRGVDYKCGTGHGVGYMLGVHTGPQGIRYRYVADRAEAVLKTGMTVSDEPGVYIEGRYGIRTENILEIRDVCVNSDGHFMGFAHLTYVPIDRDLIDTRYMEPHDIELLNSYHAAVRSNILPLIEDENEREWLIRATEAV
ncbi:MAG: aminopeptidase P family protein [Lachnospiraceae bacterium]|nr:aminopeptidase P family protein [Lachnospiraceae bacterium]